MSVMVYFYFTSQREAGCWGSEDISRMSILNIYYKKYFSDNIFNLFHRMCVLNTKKFVIAY